LGYSASTVSKALNDSSEISILTKRHITKYAKLHDYKPNLYAQALRRNKSLILGVILPDLKDMFFLDALVGITEESSKYNYKIMVYQTCNQYEKEVTYSKLLAESNIIDGLIYSPSLETTLLKKVDHLKIFKKKGIPIIHIVKQHNFNFSSNIPHIKTKPVINTNQQINGFDTGQNAVRYFLNNFKIKHTIKLNY